MTVNLMIAGLILRLDAQRELTISPEIIPFTADDGAQPDVTVRVSWDWHGADRLHSQPVGRDKLLIYYRENGWCYCRLDGGDRPPVAQTRYSPDFSCMECTVNTVDFDVPQDTVRQILRMLPIRQLLLSRQVLFLHAAQIVYRDRGILFSAPSGTGKTTQAKLWQRCRGAQILCNDRTLIRFHEGQWRTYGYPYDGSDPVGCNRSQTLGCVVLLRQGPVNSVSRLRPVRAISRLMGQTVIDGWDAASCNRAIGLIAGLFEQIPVYDLCCTADEEAVAVLEEALRKEGVIHG